MVYSRDIHIKMEAIACSSFGGNKNIEYLGKVMDKKHRTSRFLVQVGPVTNEAILWKYYTNVLSN